MEQTPEEKLQWLQREMAAAEKLLRQLRRVIGRLERLTNPKKNGCPPFGSVNG